MPPAFSSDGSCWRMTHLAKKTDTPGRFTFRSQSMSIFRFLLSVQWATDALWSNERERTALFTTKSHSQYQLGAIVCLFCLQDGTMTMTCVSWMPSMMSSLLSTPWKPKMVCLRSWTNFTVRTNLLVLDSWYQKDSWMPWGRNYSRYRFIIMDVLFLDTEWHQKDTVASIRN